MMNSQSNDTEEAQVRHVVYAMDSNGHIAHILGVARGRDELDECMDKWWKAFDSGEKKQPRDYGGISHRPVADFESWKEGDRDE